MKKIIMISLLGGALLTTQNELNAFSFGHAFKSIGHTVAQTAEKAGNAIAHTVDKVFFKNSPK